MIEWLVPTEIIGKDLMQLINYRLKLVDIFPEQNWNDSIRKLKEKLSEIRNLHNHDMTRLTNYTWGMV